MCPPLGVRGDRGLRPLFLTHTLVPVLGLVPVPVLVLVLVLALVLVLVLVLGLVPVLVLALKSGQHLSAW